MNSYKCIKDIAKVTNGKSDVKDALSYGKYPFYDRSTLIKRSNKYLFDSEAIIIAGEDSRQVFEPRHYIGKFDLHQRCYVIYDFMDGYSPKYLYYKLKTLTKHFANVCVGSTVPSLRLDHISEIKIEFPKNDIQQKIAIVLSDLDAKIELNTKINAELESMAKLLYDYWFVQYDFPDENGKPYKSSGGKMVYNEELNREIPEGWGATTVETILQKQKSVKKVQAKEYGIDGIIPIIDQSTRFICGYIDDESYMLKGKDDPIIVFGDHTRIFKYVNFDFARGADGTQILSSNTNKLPATLLYQILKMIDLSNYGYARHFKFLKETTIILPKENTATKYDSIVKLYWDKIRSKIVENRELSKLRDFLLPMLMNGQVRVR
ncbi:restriction endonuclease subunit S [bacterium]|nr:restriction endonuclease subunit S [bacterium]